jgi:hypothetical protein
MCTQTDHEVEAVDRRQTTIHDHYRVLPSQAQVKADLAIARKVDAVTRVREEFDEQRGQLSVVLDQEDPRPGRIGPVGPALAVSFRHARDTRMVTLRAF